MEQFQLKLDWWFHWHLCKKINKRKMKIQKKYSIFFKIISLSFFHFNLGGLIKTIWMEQFQLKLDWWIHWEICKKIKKRNKSKKGIFIKKYSISLKSFHSFFFYLFFSFRELQNNQLTGTVPSQIINLPNYQSNRSPLTYGPFVWYCTKILIFF